MVLSIASGYANPLFLAMPLTISGFNPIDDGSKLE